MKTKRFILMALAILAGAGLATAGTNEVSALLQKGLFEEEANRNLDAAIQAYQAVVTQTDKDRQFAATAIFRLGECYRKQGKTNEAAAQYQRILREFPDQAELARLSREYAGASAIAPAIVNQEGVAVFKAEIAAGIAAAKAEIKSYRQQLEELTTEPDARRVFAQQHFPNPVLNALMQKMAETEQILTEQRSSLGDNHPDVKRSEALLKTISEQVNVQIRVIMSDLGNKLNVAEGSLKDSEARLKELETLQQTAQQNQANPANASLQISPNETSKSAPDPEAEEIKRLQAEVKDSPDLINAGDSRGFTPLNAAVRNGQLKVVKFLVDNKANIEKRDGTTLTPLLSAAQTGHKEIIEFLLDRGADVNAVSTINVNNQFSSWRIPPGYSSLHYAVESGNKAMAEVLLAHGAMVDARDASGQTALMLAAKSGFKTVAEMLIARGANVNAGDAEGKTALIAAITAGNRAMVELLLANKADVNLKTRDGFTPLIAAVNAAQPETARLLLEHGADANAKMANDHGSTPRWTALDAAVAKNDNTSVKLFLENHADPNATFDLSDRGNVYERDSTPLILAADWQHQVSAKILLSHKADVNWRNGQGNTALWIAVQKGDQALAELLLEQGADPGIKYDKADGWTVLHLAVRNRKKELAELLLAHGANINSVDNTGATALHLAVSAGQQPMVELLLAHGADVNLKDNRGNTALDLAQNQNQPGYQPMPGRPFSVNGAATNTNDITVLLRRHGALAEVDVSTIRVTRQGMQSASIVFRNVGADGHNHFTMFELLAEVYAPPSWNPYQSAPESEPPGLRFPDFSKIKIHRLEHGGRAKTLDADLEAGLATGDCGKDVPLKWGDVVEIPEADHKVNEHWNGLDNTVRATLKKCLQAKVEIVVKGQITQVTLTADTPVFASNPQSLAPTWHAYTAFRGESSGPSPKTELWSFWLNDVVHQANVILHSSDLTKVKVKRADAETHKTEEMVFNLEKNVSGNDLWLRDGDVIEIPEKQ